jgi:ABC-type molybdate transport system substrate-binding protein
MLAILFAIASPAVATDVVIVMNKVGLADLISQGKIVPGTAVDLAQTALGLAVRSGSPKLDIRTVEAFKQTLLRPKSVTFDSSTTGIYLTTTSQLQAAKQLIDFLSSASAASAIRKIGMEPVKPR